VAEEATPLMSPVKLPATPPALWRALTTPLKQEAIEDAAGIPFEKSMRRPPSMLPPSARPAIPPAFVSEASTRIEVDEKLMS
jgi:hypothetical protein